MQTIKLIAIIIITIIAVKFGALNALWMFLLVGAVPGTIYSLPSSAMFIILGGIVWLAFCQPTLNHTIRHLIANGNHAKKIAHHAARMPRRRFGQI